MFTSINEHTRKENEQSTEDSFFKKSLNWFSTKKNKTIYKNLLKIQDKDLSQVVTARFLAEPTDLFFQTYKFVCERQEEYFQTAFPSYFIPYALSKWESYSFPRMLPMERQSLANLKIGIQKQTGEAYCEPCKEGYEIFKGRNYYFQNDPEGSNKGYCVQTLIALLNELGMKGEECKTCKWFVNWIGTQEAAQRRLDNFRKEQDQRSLNSDPRYNILNYYMTLIRLQMDLKLKQFLELTEKNPSEEDLEKAREDTTFDKYAKELFGSGAKYAIHLKKKLADLFVVTGLVLYKLLSFLINQPFFIELMLVCVKSFIDDMCLKMNVKNNKVKILQSSDDGKSVGQFNFETGLFEKLSEEDSKKYLEEKINVENKVWSDKAFTIYTALSEYVSNGKWKEVIEERKFINSNMLDDTLEALEQIWLIGPVFKRVGRSKVKNMIESYLVTQGQSTYETILKFNQINQFKRFATMFYSYYTSNCGGETVLMDGIHFNKTVKQKFYDAYINALYNIPYYALMILVEESYNDEGYISGVKGGENKSARFISDKEKKINRQKFIEILIVDQLVGGSLSQEKDRQTHIWRASGDKFLEQQTKRLNQEIQEYKRLIHNATASNQKMTLADTVAYKKQIEEQFGVDDLNNMSKEVEDRLYEENKKQIQEKDASYLNKKNLLMLGAAAVTIGGIVCASYPPCAGAVIAGAKAAAVYAAKTAPIANTMKLGKDFARVTNVNANNAVEIARKLGLIQGGQYILRNKDRFTAFLSKKTEPQKKLISKLMSDPVTSMKVLEEINKQSDGQLFKAGKTIFFKASETGIRYYSDAKVKFEDYANKNKLLNLSSIIGIDNGRNLIFRQKLNDFLDKFEAKNLEGTREEFLEMQKVVNEKQSVQYLWPRNYKRSNINSKKVAEFFKTYQPMRVQA